ncbi:hypothetical protein AB0M28_29285 [Streptomyces sp. NPDC051940]|uniref:hypothetical protein n=1 Tax=Streptomyces sp. NPDC051940 TaxID=3155675 RepID=UPI00342115B0
MSDVLEIVCDESGSDGENLMGGNTAVFAHSGVHISPAEAAAPMAEARRRIGSPASIYGATHFLRPKHRDALLWLLGRDGPLHGRAHVHLTDKAYYAVRQVMELLLGEGEEDRAPAARELYRTGREKADPVQWTLFLRAANDLMRTKPQAADPVAVFFAQVGELQTAWGASGAQLERLAGTRARAEEFRARLLDAPAAVPAMDPFLPALVRTVEHWSAPGRPVTIVHDRQNALTEERLAWLRGRVGDRLAEVRMNDPKTDVRIQLADFLAGIARKAASDELAGRPDVQLRELLRPYVDRRSVWSGGPVW